MHQSTFYTLAYCRWPILSGLPWCMFVWLFIYSCVCAGKCVRAHVPSRSGCSSDSLFADRNEHAVSLGVRWAETGEEEWKRRRGRTTGEEKHIGHHLFITLTPSVHCQGEGEEREGDEADEDSKARATKTEETLKKIYFKKQRIGSLS